MNLDSEMWPQAAQSAGGPKKREEQEKPPAAPVNTIDFLKWAKYCLDLLGKSWVANRVV